MKRLVTFLMILFLVAGCNRDTAELVNPVDETAQTAPNETHQESPKGLTDDDWVGMYASIAEFSGWNGVALGIEKKESPEKSSLNFRLSFFSDVSPSPESIDRNQFSGTCTTQGDMIFIPMAAGLVRDGKSTLTSSVLKYKRVTINDHVVLMNEHAFTLYNARNRIEDHITLVRVERNAEFPNDYRRINNPSLRILNVNTEGMRLEPLVAGNNSK